jgi:hypothetical protein
MRARKGSCLEAAERQAAAAIAAAATNYNLAIGVAEVSLERARFHAAFFIARSVAMWRRAAREPFTM